MRSAPLVGLLAALAAGESVFSDPAIFERISHFKDVGVPHTLNDPFNRAAIADGACRSVVRAPVDGYAYWHSPDKVDAVISAIQQLPATTGPSNMTLAAKRPDFAKTACLKPATRAVNQSFYELTAAKGSMQAWFRALCQPEFDDPAYQPQQMTLTVGFMCAVACDANQAQFGAYYATVSSHERAQDARDTLCNNMPGYEPDFFTGTIRTWKELRYAVGPIFNTPCKCGHSS